MFLFLADLMALAVLWKQSTEGRILTREDGTQYVVRPGYSEPDTELTAHTDGYGVYDIDVEARQYTEEELDRMAGQLLQELPGRITVSVMGDDGEVQVQTADLCNVMSPLSLPSSVSGYPFRITWQSSRSSVLDAEGGLHTEDMEEGTAETVILRAALSCQGRKYEQDYTVTAVRPTAAKEEKIKEAIQEALYEEDRDSTTSDIYELPGEVDGRSIVWYEPESYDSILILVLLAAAGVITFFLSDRQLHREVETRSRQMISDYPQIVSRFVLLVGAGMSVRNVFCKMGNDYRRKRENGGEKRYVYEEILLVCNELESGISENSAYAHFGERCRIRQYNKMCALLVQNLKKGNSSLLTALQDEARSSDEERRQNARVQGEIAGTRLLFPMMLMLGVTMVIIVIPAYLSFSV